MATTVNNTTINDRLTILFDAAPNKSTDDSYTEKFTDDYYLARDVESADGPAKYSGNTEADVYIDATTILNLKCHTEVPSEVHCLQWNASTNTGEIEYTDNRENSAINVLPSWVTNVVIRFEAELVYRRAYAKKIKDQEIAWIDGGNTGETFVGDDSEATTYASTERDNYLLGFSITF